MKRTASSLTLRDPLPPCAAEQLQKVFGEPFAIAEWRGIYLSPQPGPDWSPTRPAISLNQPISPNYRQSLVPQAIEEEP
jgi:hypothetical protein